MAKTKEYKCGCVVTIGFVNTVIELCRHHRVLSHQLIVLANDQVQWEGEITA